MSPKVSNHWNPNTTPQDPKCNNRKYNSLQQPRNSTHLVNFHHVPISRNHQLRGSRHDKTLQLLHQLWINKVVITPNVYQDMQRFFLNGSQLLLMFCNPMIHSRHEWRFSFVPEVELTPSFTGSYHQVSPLLGNILHLVLLIPEDTVVSDSYTYDKVYTSHCKSSIVIQTSSQSSHQNLRSILLNPLEDTILPQLGIGNNGLLLLLWSANLLVILVW